MTGMRSLYVLALLGAPGAVAGDSEPPRESPALRQRAENLARAASDRFSDLLGDRPQQQLAQSAAPPASGQQPAEAGGTFAPVWGWLARSSQAYEDLVIAQLKNSDGWTVIVQRSGDSQPAGETALKTAQAQTTPTLPRPVVAEPPSPQLQGWSGFVERVREWLARANRSYRNEIVRPLLAPPAGEQPSEIAVQPPNASPPPPAAPVVIPTAPLAADADGSAVGNAKAEDEIKREAQAAAEKRRADEQAAAQARLAADAAEAKRSAEEAASKRRAENQAAVAQRRADQERRAAAAEAERRAEAEVRAKRIEAAAAERRKADADAKRQAEEADAAERRAVAEAEAETKRKAEIEADATRRSQQAARDKQAAREAMAKAPAAPATAPAASAAAGAAARIDSESSDVAIRPSSADDKSTADDNAPASPSSSSAASRKAREETVVAEAAPQPVKKRAATRSLTKSKGGNKYAYGPRHKTRHAYKQRRPRWASASPRKRAARAQVRYVVRDCACRCGSVFARPQKARRGMWRSYAAPRAHKRHGGRLTYRGRVHYID